jgi:rod shape-determining protein MreD
VTSVRHYWIALAVLGCFVLEGTLVEWVIPPTWQTKVYVVPHLVLIAVLYISMFTNRYLGLTYGLAFGLLQDVIYYGHSIGVYSFSLGLVGYAAGLSFRRAQFGIVTSLLVALFGLLLYETMIFGIYRVFLNVIRLTMEWAFLHQMLPSTLFNLLLALALYVPARKWLEPKDAGREGEEK